MTRSRWCLGAAISLFVASFAPGGEPPSVSDLRIAFEAQFPKSDANGTALELERLASALGINLVPGPFPEPPKEGETPPPPNDGRVRPAPGTEMALPLLDFLQRELAVSDERIGRAPPAVERFLEEREGEISAIESILLGNEEPRWEMDVAAGTKSPIPNLLGVLRLQRLLLTRALVLARAGETDAAVETMEASWRLHGALLSRPELISQLIAIAVAKLQVGVLRKIDSPAYGWSERLRSPGSGAAGIAAALANEIWTYSTESSHEEGFASYARTYRRFLANLEPLSLCSWSEAILKGAWEDAVLEMDDENLRIILLEIQTPNLSNGLLRARRLAIDSELTALVLDARAERAALRRPRWPAKLLTLNTGVCSEARWAYRVERNGTARFRLETAIDDPDVVPFRLPLEFTAGKPLVRRPARKGVVVNPAPAIGR